jgi:hypothetical protein
MRSHTVSTLGVRCQSVPRLKPLRQELSNSNRCTIRVRSAIQHADGGWEVLAMVWSKNMSAAHPIVSRELLVTEARAKAIALERDAKEEQSRGDEFIRPLSA